MRRKDGAAITAAFASWQTAFERLSLPGWLESKSGLHGPEHHRDLARSLNRVEKGLFSFDLSCIRISCFDM